MNHCVMFGSALSLYLFAQFAWGYIARRWQREGVGIAEKTAVLLTPSGIIWQISMQLLSGAVVMVNGLGVKGRACVPSG